MRINCKALDVVLLRASNSACILPAYLLLSATRSKDLDRLSMLASKGAIAPMASSPNISFKREICSSFGLSANACKTLKIVPWASVCMSLAICSTEKPREEKAAAASLESAVPEVKTEVNFFRAVLAISGLAPAERKAVPSAATCVSERPHCMASAPTRWMTSPRAGAVAFILLERWFTASARAYTWGRLKFMPARQSAIILPA